MGFLVVQWCAFLITQTPPIVAADTSTSTVTLGTAIQAGGGLGAFGLIAWLVKRVFTHTIPRLAKDFKDSLQVQSDLFAQELKYQRELFEQESIRMRDDFRAELQKQREDFKNGITREREFFDEQLTKLSASIDLLDKVLNSYFKKETI